MTTARIGRDKILISGIKPLDAVHKQFKVHGLQRVFREAGIYEAKHRKYGLDLWYEVDMDTTSSIAQAMDAFRGIGQIEKIEPIYKKRIHGSERSNFGPVAVSTTATAVHIGKNGPSDPLFSQQWNYNNSGQTGGVPGADIDLLRAWKLETGKRKVIVAVMDGGIQYDHPDLAANMWMNSGEIPGNHLDDDNNGYVDDIYGYGFGDNIGTIIGNPHGTHVAGTIAAVTNNGIGVSGIAGGSGSDDGIRLMSCAVFGSQSQGHFPESYVYAADMGAVISQNSWEYYWSYESAVLDAINYFIAEAGKDESGNQTGPMQGGLVVFAAGNDYGYYSPYPAIYEPVVAVAATNDKDLKTEYSNFGFWVDISAPGGEFVNSQSEEILSTLNNNQYGFFEGTSMACPHVSGVAALLISKFGEPGYTPTDLKQRLFQTADNLNFINPKYSKGLGSGRLNAYAALHVPDSVGPDAIQDLSVTAISSTSLTFSWTSPLDIGDLPAAVYDLRYSSDTITSENFDSATAVPGLPESDEQGVLESFTITGLIPGAYYFIALKAIDINGNTSGLSNVVYQKTYLPSKLSLTPSGFTASLQTSDSTIRTLTLYNRGEDVLDFSFVQNNQNAFAVAKPNNGKILSGDSLNVVVTINASNFFTGTYHQNLILKTNDPLQSNLSIPVQMVVTNNNAPIFISSLTELNFGNINIGTTSIKKINVRNGGTEILVLDTLSLTSDIFTIGLSFPLSILPFDTVSLPIHFTPSVVGSFSDAAIIVTSDPSIHEFSIPISGNGYDPHGGITVKPQSLTANLRPGETSSQALMVHNNSALPVSFTVKVDNDGFYNTAMANTNTLAQNQSTAEKKTKNTESFDLYSPKFNSLNNALTSNSTNSSFATQSAATFQYATDFESFNTGDINQQGWYWYGTDRWVISSTNPARGQQNLRFNPGTGISYAFSPVVAIGTELKSTVKLKVNRGQGSTGWWQIMCGSISTGYVNTRIQLEDKDTISVLLNDGNGNYHFEPIPFAVPHGYFDLTLEVVRATNEFTLYIDDKKVFSGLGFAGNIEQVAFIANSDGAFDVDDFRIIDGGIEGIPYINVNPLTATLAAGDSVSLTANFDAAHLRFGEYSSTIAVQPQGWIEIDVPATLFVTGEPLLTLNGAVPMFVATGKDTTAQFSLTNIGGMPTDYNMHIVYSDADTAWLTITPVSGFVPVMGHNEIYLQAHYDASHLNLGVYSATLQINSDAPVLNIPITLHVTTPGQIVVEPNTLYIEVPELDASADFTIQNTGGTRLNYIIESNTHFRSPHFTTLSKKNSEPVSPGLDDLAAIPNTAELGWSYQSSFFEQLYWYDDNNRNVDGFEGWAADGENWEVRGPHAYEFFMRGRSDGSGVPSAMYSPRVISGSERVSNFLINVNFIYSAGTSWQIIPQSSADSAIVTRLQINPDRTIQVLVRDSLGHSSFQRIIATLPNDYFKVRMEIEKETSLFTIFFNNQRVFTGRGFADHVDQVAVLSQMEKDGSTIFVNEFSINDGSSLLLIKEYIDYTDYLVNKTTGYVEPGESITRGLYFTASDLTPGIYKDSIKIITDDPDKSVLYLPYTLQVDRPFVQPDDYVQPAGKLDLTYDTLEATIYKGDVANINLTLHNPNAVEQTLYFPKPIDAPVLYRAYWRESQNFHWTDISVTGTRLMLGDDDSQTITMPFTFNFTTTSNLLTIGSNGYLSLGAVRADNPINKNMNFNQTQSYDEIVDNVIAPYWSDLTPDDSSAIYYHFQDDKVIVQYTNVPYYGTNMRNTFQAILSREGTILFQYLHMNDQQRASIGASTGSLSTGNYYPVSLTYNEPFVTDSLAIMIHPPEALGVYDSLTDTPLYSLYPWIVYPDEGSISVGPQSSQSIGIQLSSTASWWGPWWGNEGMSLPIGVTKGNLFLFGHPYQNVDYYFDDQYDGGAFFLPVKVTVLDNPPPVIDPLQPISLVEGESKVIVITATDPNDTQITVSLDNPPNFVTLLQSQDGSVEYKIDPASGDAGEYTLLVRAKDPHGAVDVDTLYLSVIPANGIINFSLIYFKTGATVSTFDQQVTLDVADPDIENYTIQANIAGKVGSVKFMLDGHKVNIDNNEPFTINAWSLPVLSSGSHTLVAQSFSKNNARGNLTNTKEASLFITNSAAITSFQIVDRNGNKIKDLFDGDIIHEDQLGSNGFNIIANTSISNVRSVQFVLNGLTARIDNRAPYAIHGRANGYDTPWNAKPGIYTLTAIPYMKYYAWGPKGISSTIHFTILNNTQNAIATAKEAQSGSGDDVENESQKLLSLYPNPVVDELNISLSNINDGQFILKIMNLNDQVLYTHKGDAQTIQALNISTNQLGLSSGVYYIQLIGANGFNQVVKFIKQ